MLNVFTLKFLNGLYVKGSNQNNKELADAISVELLSKGYSIQEELYNQLRTADFKDLLLIHDQIKVFFKEHFEDGSDYKPLFDNFPNSLSFEDKEELILLEVFNLWSPDSEPSDDFCEAVKISRDEIKTLKLLEKEEVDSLFYNKLYANTSLDLHSRELVLWFIDQGYEFDPNKIAFQETQAIVGSKLLCNNKKLQFNSATTVLRTVYAYSSGDATLKENHKIVNLSNSERRIIMSCLDKCKDLEESFKTHREKWLRLLFFLHPNTKKNTKRYPTLAKYASLIRNNPKQLQTFNSNIESLIKNSDPKVFELLKNKMGVFTRRLDHLYRVFGFVAIENWISNEPRVEQCVDVYNHFKRRTTATQLRVSSLSISGIKKIVSYKGLPAIDEIDVENICESIKTYLSNKENPLMDKNVFISNALYYVPFKVNSRTNNLDISGNYNGKTEVIPSNVHTIRVYIHWQGRDDIDLSASCFQGSAYSKIGWNSSDHLFGIRYSGDNTGLYDKNSEYLDINLNEAVNNDVDWIVLDSYVFRGPTYKNFSKPVKIGWIELDGSEVNDLNWNPKNVRNAIKVKSDSTSIYIMAIHPKTRKLVYLDMTSQSKGGNISTEEGAIIFKTWLDERVDIQQDETKVSWEKLNQGQVLNLLSKQVVKKDESDVQFDSLTTQESLLMLVR